MWVAALVTVIIALAWQIGPGADDDGTPASASDDSVPAVPDPGQEPNRQEERPILLRATTSTAEALDPVQVTGTYPGVPAGTKLVVQWRREGEWVALPLPTAVLATGRFSTYVQLGEEGQHRLRVVDTSAGTMSNSITLRIS